MKHMLGRVLAWTWPLVAIGVASGSWLGCQDLEPVEETHDAGPSSEDSSTQDVLFPEATPETSPEAEAEAETGPTPDACSAPGAQRWTWCSPSSVRPQKCVDGQWTDQGKCEQLPTCDEPGKQRLGTCLGGTPGVQPERCDQGHWRPVLGCFRSWQWRGGEQDIARSVAVDGEGNVYVAGLTMGHLPNHQSAGQVDNFLIKLSADGSELWTRQWGGAKNDAASSVAVDSHGNAFVVGYSEREGKNGSGPDSDGFVTKFSPDGQQLWTTWLSTSGTDGAVDATIHANDQLLVTGYTFGNLLGAGSHGRQEAFVVAVDQNGKVAWAKNWGTVADDNGTGIVTDSQQNIELLTVTTGTVGKSKPRGGSDFALVGMNAHGEMMAGAQASFGTCQNDTALGITPCREPGHVWIAGFTYGQFDGQKFLGQLDAFVAKVNVMADGGPQIETVDQFGTNSFDLAKSVTLVDGEGPYVCGDTYGTQWNGNANAGEFDMFLSRRDGQGRGPVVLLGSFGTDQCHDLAAHGRTLWMAGHAGGHLPSSDTGVFGSIAVVRVALNIAPWSSAQPRE